MQTFRVEKKKESRTNHSEFWIHHSELLKGRVDGESPAVEGRETSVCIYGEGDGAELQAPGLFPAVEFTVSVEIISQQRVTEGSQMCPDLMGAAGDQMNAQTRDRSAFQRLITSGDRLYSRFLMIRDPNPGMKRILYQPGVANGLRRFHYSTNKTDIIFLKLTAAENILQDIKGLLVFREEAQSAGFIVQTMAGCRRISLRVVPPDIFQAQVREGNAAAGIRLNADPGALIDEEHVIILIYHGKGRGSSRAAGGRIRNIDLQLLSFTDSLVAGNTNAIQFHIPGSEDTAKHTLRKIRE